MQNESRRPAGAPDAKGGDTAITTMRDVLRQVRWPLRFVALFSLFINLLMLTGPLFMLQVYDRVLPSGSVPTLVALFALVIILFVTLGVLEQVRASVLNRVGIRLYRLASSRAFEAVMRLSLASRGNAAAVAPLGELAQIQQFVSGSGPASLFDFPWVPVYLALIFFLHPLLGWLAVSFAVLLFLVALVNEMRARRPMKAASERAAKAAQFTDAVRDNAEALKSMGMLRTVFDRWEQSNLLAMQAAGTARDRMGGMAALSKALRLLMQAAMLALGAYLVIGEEITAGAMIAASIILGRALAPVEQSITHWRGFVRAREAYAKLDALFARMPSKSRGLSLARPQGRLSATNLSVVAPGGDGLILQGINFTLEPGTILAVVGRNAAGKSSLLRTLAGVWPPARGELRLDGATYEQWDEEEFGRFIGYVAQDGDLLGGTIAENISRFRPDAREEDIFAAARLAGIDDMIKRMPDGYNFDIGHLGARLSAGQRQLIALARALYGDPPLLILDEPNANLDGAGDEALVRALMHLRSAGRTIILVSHRWNYVRFSDLMLELDDRRQTLFGPSREVVEKIRQRRLPPPAPPGETHSVIELNRGAAMGFAAPPRVDGPARKT